MVVFITLKLLFLTEESRYTNSHRDCLCISVPVKSRSPAKDFRYEQKVNKALINIQALTNKIFIVNDLINEHKLDFTVLFKIWLGLDETYFLGCFCSCWSRPWSRTKDKNATLLHFSFSLVSVKTVLCLANLNLLTNGRIGHSSIGPKI